MKIKTTTLAVSLLVFALLTSSYAAQRIPSKVTFRVQDVSGQAVSNAVVTGHFLAASKTGKGSTFKEVTDGEGVAVVEGMTVKGIYAECEKKDFYKTKIKEEVRIKKGRRKKKQPALTSWNRDIPVVLKPVKNPVSMKTKAVMNPYVMMQNSDGSYNLNKSAKYDFVKGDFLPPHGNGEVSDIEFDWEMSIQKKIRSGRPLDYKTKCTINVPGMKNGIIKGNADGDFKSGIGSGLMSDYEAPSDGYLTNMIFYKTVANHKVQTNIKNDNLYYFRIRTETGRRRVITNAFYGKIYGPLNGNFQYYLNPNGLNRNIEDDPAKNIKLK